MVKKKFRLWLEEYIISAWEIYIQIKRAFSIKSVEETFAVNREKSRLYGPHARPAMRQRKADNTGKSEKEKVN